MAHKYGAIPTEFNGRRFASKGEAKRAQDLELKLCGGVITDLEYQPRYELQPAFVKNGKKYRAIYFVADYKYYDCESMKVVVEDFKGMATPVFKLKQKMFEYRYPEIELKVIR